MGLGQPIVECYIVVIDTGPSIKEEKRKVSIDECVARLPQHVLNHTFVERPRCKARLIELLSALETGCIDKANW